MHIDAFELPTGSSVGFSGLSNHSQAGGCRQVGSLRSYWLHERNPASFTARPGVKDEPPSAQEAGGNQVIIVGTGFGGDCVELIHLTGHAFLVCFDRAHARIAGDRRAHVRLVEADLLGHERALVVVEAHEADAGLAPGCG